MSANHIGCVVRCVIIAAVVPVATHGGTASARGADDAFFEGSAIVSMPNDFQPELIYKKFPTDDAVHPSQTWQLSFGILLDSMDPSISVTLQFDPEGQNADIQITDDTASFVPQNGLYSNYDPAARFEIVYTGANDPFLGPVDFMLEPDGFDAVPVRVHLNVIEQTGFPLDFLPPTGAASPVGDLTGDGNLEIVVPGSLGGVDGLHTFDHTGTPLPGWPLRSEDPDVVDQSFAAPAIVNLDQAGPDEVVVLGSIRRNVPHGDQTRGFEITYTLYAVEGSGQIRWQVTDDFEPIAIPAVGDLDGDGELDILIGAASNLKRFDADGAPLDGWQVQTPDDVSVAIPVIADVDSNPANGMEIIACTPIFEPPHDARVYVWNQDGSPHGPAWPKTVDNCRAPTVLDLDDNPSNGLEIVVSVDRTADPPVDPSTGFLNTFSVLAWHADGTDAAGWPHDFQRDPNAGFYDDRLIASDCAGDVDGDGDLELLVGTYGQGDPANGNLFMFHHDGSLDGNWPRWAGIAQNPSAWGGRALGDLNGDDQLEIVTGSIRGVYAFSSTGQLLAGFPKLTTDNFAQPIIGDLDGDGRAEIVQASRLGRLHVWEFLTPVSGPSPWPRFRQNATRTGALAPESAEIIPTVSEVGATVLCILLVCVGAVVIRRNAPASSPPPR